MNDTPYTQRTWWRRRVVPWAYETGRSLKRLWSDCWIEIIMLPVVFAFFYLTGCTKIVEPEDVVSPDDLADIAEAYCATHPELTCGHVYLCGETEICVLDKTELPSEYGACEPTPRHQGLCWWCCGEGCGAGCNAYSGCYCPTVEVPPDAGVTVDAFFDPFPQPPVK